MSTEPDWRAVASIEGPHLLGAPWGSGIQPASMLLSFERPAPARRQARSRYRDRVRTSPTQAGVSLSTVLENCTEATSAAIDKRRLKTGITGPLAIILVRTCLDRGAEDHDRSDHRQDSKGTWWMPWHQESMKGVNGCDKPRLGAE
jgi:hypothetical protein